VTDAEASFLYYTAMVHLHWLTEDPLQAFTEKFELSNSPNATRSYLSTLS
jgi:hypothetical protein